MSCVINPMEDGKVNERLLPLRSRNVSCVSKIAVGMLPHNELAPRFKDESCVKRSNADGMDPVNALLPRSRNVSSVRRPISEGIVPRRLRARRSNRVVVCGSQFCPNNITVGPTTKGARVGRDALGGVVAGGVETG